MRRKGSRNSVLFGVDGWVGTEVGDVDTLGCGAAFCGVTLQSIGAGVTQQSIGAVVGAGFLWSSDFGGSVFCGLGCGVGAGIVNAGFGVGSTLGSG